MGINELKRSTQLSKNEHVMQKSTNRARARTGYKF
jgi:hypothetical protein